MTREELNENLIAIRELCDGMPYCEAYPFGEKYAGGDYDNECKLIVSSPALWKKDENGAIKIPDLLDLLFDLQKSIDEYKMWKALEKENKEE